MHILLYGSSLPHALESFYEKHIKTLGHQINIFNGADQFQDYYNQSLFNKILYRTNLSSVEKRINYQFLKVIEEQKPDAIVVFKGMQLKPSTIKKIKSSGIVIANYNPDHPFYFYGRGSGNDNVVQSIPFYSFHISYSLQIIKELNNRYKVNCEWLPFGFEPSNLPLPKPEEEINRVCFIGFADKVRVDIIRFLAESGIPIDVYGPNWSKYIKNQNNINIQGPVFNEKFNETALKYRVQLNLFRPHNVNSHNMRTFEMPGIGCIMLAPDSKEHRMFFEPGKEAFFYNSHQDMLNKINNLLNLSYKEALTIRKKARNRCLSSGYDYKNRTKNLISIIEKKLN